MACSICLPELINEIIKFCNYDYKTLYSCILVNRLWCRIAIPLLWEDPFSIKFPKNHHFIEIYLYNLNEEEKTKLNEYINYNDLSSSNTLFNYPSFIQSLVTHRISCSIDEWTKTIGNSKTKVSNSNSNFMLKKNLFQSRISNFKKLIYRSLFRIFIENEVNLYSFKVEMFSITEIEYFDEIFELIIQNPNFICKIKDFMFDCNNIFNRTSENITRFSKFLCTNCNSISSLDFQLQPSYNYPTIERCLSLSQIINYQKNLEKILIGYDFPLYQSLLSLKNHPNCSNTLNTIIFHNVDFKNIHVLSEVFNQLNVLESIHIIYCHSLDFTFIQQISKITKPFKLKSLFLTKILQTEELLIQKSCDYLENFGIINNETHQILELIIKYCNKIQFLGPIWMNYLSIYLTFDLIKNFEQNLNYLFLETLNVHLSSNILQNLGQVLPYKLNRLNLNLSSISANDLEIFLKNSQNTFVKKLLIRNKKKRKNVNLFPYIREYIMKEKRVKYFAFSEIIYSRIDDLFFMKDKVKEFELYDIQVLCYKDLLIYDYIRGVV
jgi:hypothetical protein